MSQASNLTIHPHQTSGFPGSGTLEFFKMTDKRRYQHLPVLNIQECNRFSVAEDILFVIADHSECLDVYKGRAQATCGCKLLHGAYCFENWGITEVPLLSSPVRDRFVLMVFILITQLHGDLSLSPIHQCHLYSNSTNIELCLQYI